MMKICMGIYIVVVLVSWSSVEAVAYMNSHFEFSSFKPGTNA